MIIFSRREEIAIAILVACARAEARITTDQAALAAETTQTQTAQIVHRLMRAGLLETLRGKGGGIRLARAPEHIRLDMVLDGMGARRRAAISHSGNSMLDSIARVAASRALDTYVSFTIADLANERIADKLTCLDCTIRLGAARRPSPSHGLSPDRQHLAQTLNNFA